jgi:hypothetical protein
MEAKPNISEQECRWYATIGDLVSVTSHVPDHEALNPRYTIGRDRVWRIRLTTGEIGWARARSVDDLKHPCYYLPPTIAHECFLHEAMALRLTLEWAQSKQGKTRDSHLVTAILNASPEWHAKLQASVDDANAKVEAANETARQRYNESLDRSRNSL